MGENALHLRLCAAAAENIVQVAQQGAAPLFPQQNGHSLLDFALRHGGLKGGPGGVILSATHAPDELLGSLVFRPVVDVMQDAAPERLFFIAGFYGRLPVFKKPVQDLRNELPLPVFQIHLFQIHAIVPLVIELVHNGDPVRQVEEAQPGEIPRGKEKLDGGVLAGAMGKLRFAVLQNEGLHQLKMILLQRAGGTQQRLDRLCCQALCLLHGDDPEFQRSAGLLKSNALKILFKNGVPFPGKIIHSVGDGVFQKLVEEQLSARQRPDALREPPVKRLRNVPPELSCGELDQPLMGKPLPGSDADAEHPGQGKHRGKCLRSLPRASLVADQDVFVKKIILIDRIQ